MTDEEMAEEQIKKWDSVLYPQMYPVALVKDFIRKAYLAGLNEGRPKWHKIFEDKPPYSYEYYDLPQNRLPKIENFYFVKLKNGFIKICELKYDAWSRKMYFYDLHGGKQSNVAEWLDYPTFDKE